MKEKNINIFIKSKEELINNALNTKTFKAIIIGGISVGGIFILGKVFKILAIANTNLTLLKNSFNQQN
jgi:hypothetical protein